MSYRTNTLLLTGVLVSTLGLVSACGGGSSSTEPAANADSDNDGVIDSLDAFPNDPTESVDTDGDGIGNNEDLDDDADGLLDTNDENPLDTDNDTIPNSEDDDDDDDGVLDVDDAFPLDQSESVDSDNDGIGDNADTDSGPGGDPGTVTPITTGSADCIINPGADGNATFAGAWTWNDSADAANDLSVAYAIEDNTTACGGVGGLLPGIPGDSYSLSWQLPVEGGFVMNVLLTVTAVDSNPVVVQGLTDTTINFSSPDLEVGGAGSWQVMGCSLDITSVDTASTSMVAIISGSLNCDKDAVPPQVLTRLFPISTQADTSVTFTAPMTFRTSIALLGS